MGTLAHLKIFKVSNYYDHWLFSYTIVDHEKRESEASLKASTCMVHAHMLYTQGVSEPKRMRDCWEMCSTMYTSIFQENGAKLSVVRTLCLLMMGHLTG